jgi:hypothetical protein
MSSDPHKADIERHRAEYERRSIGPLGSAVMVTGPRGPEIFLKVRWNEDLKRVAEYAAEHQEFTSETRWGAIRQDGPLHFVLEIWWPEVPAHVALYFHGGRWDAELDILRTTGIVTLVEENAKGMAMIENGISVDAETDILDQWL